MRIAHVLLAASLLVLPACGDRAPGLIITEDGRMMDNSAENERAESIRTIETDLGKPLGAHWRVHATIAELPAWSAERGEGDWRWQKATVVVALLGDGSAPLPLPVDEIRQGVVDYMRLKVDRPKANLSVEVTQTSDAAAFARASAPTATSAPTPAITLAPGPRTYTVQSGDTLADISSVFYGSPQHWRRIVEANPGVDPANLAPGTVLSIPPAPPAP